MPTVADRVIARLASAGVRAIFGVPGGGGNLDLVAAAGRAGLPFVLTATETAAAIAAQAQAEVTGTLGACLTTLGPGAASVVNGVACAWLERAPLVVFTDRHASATFEHQRIDHGALFRGITKRSESIASATALAAVDRAIAAATTGRPGPVHLDCPGSSLSETARPGTSANRLRRAASAPAVSAAAAARLAKRLARARKPLVIVGLGARTSDDARRIDRLCRTRGVPAMVTYKAKGVVPDHHPWFAGVFTNGAIEQPVVGEADLILAIGLDPVELLPRPWPYRAPVVSGGPWPVGRDQVPCAERVVCTAGRFADLAQRALSPSAWREADVRAALASQRSAIDVPADGLTAPMLWPATQPHDVLISNGLATMGFAVPAALGASVAEPGRPVVAFTGDGGLLMCAGELLTIARERRPIVVVVFNDASLSLIEIKQQARRLAPAGVGIGDVDWAQLAAGLGLAAFRASTRVELADALARARTSGAPALIDARIDRSNYAATLRAIRGT
jgi:acetolactate synthase-1/2/3 large subunit